MHKRIVHRYGKTVYKITKFIPKAFLWACIDRSGDFVIELRKIEIRKHALKSAERLSEAAPSCSLPISAFSMFPDFVIFLVLWSGAASIDTFPQNMSWIPRRFCPVYVRLRSLFIPFPERLCHGFYCQCVRGLSQPRDHPCRHRSDHGV